MCAWSRRRGIRRAIRPSTSARARASSCSRAMSLTSRLSPARIPNWQGAYDQDGLLAVATRRKMLERVTSETMMIAVRTSPSPEVGTFAKDGDGYVLTLG